MDSLYFVMPAYNEEANIEHVIKAWYPLLENKDERSRLVVADSGSSDQTHDILLKLQKRFPKLVVISDTEKQHGPKVIALYNYAIENNVDYIFQTDSDGQTDSDEFEAFWQLRDRYDGIFGNRVTRGDGKVRAFVEHVVCLLLLLYFRVKIPDANAPFRLMRASVVKKYLSKMRSDYNLPNVILTTFFVYHNEKYVFKAISFKKRMEGVNSINIFKIMKIGWKALADFRVFRQKLVKNV